MKIAVLGCGNVGSTLGSRLAKNGHEVIFGVRDPQKEKVVETISECGATAKEVVDAIRESEILIYAAWWSAAQEICEAAGDFEDKILIDCVNPLKFGATGLEGIELGFNTSAGEKLQEMAPTSRVVKCFNTVSAQTMANPVIDGVKGDVYICGNDEEARKVVSGIAEELDFNPLDCGDITSSRYIEPMACLWIKLAFSGMGADFITKVASRK